MDLLWWLSIGTECAALASLLIRRIAPFYRWFASYLAFGVVRGIGLHFAGDPAKSHNYAAGWMITEPLLLLLLILTTTEIVAKVPGYYRAFGSFGRQSLRRLLDIAIVLALASSVIEAASGTQWTWSIKMLLRYAFGLHRVTTSLLALYLVLVAIFVSRVPVPFRHNLVIHSRLFACYLSMQTGFSLYFLVIGHGTATGNDLLAGGTSLLFVLWAVLLTSRGEALPPRKTLSQDEIQANEERERVLHETARRYSDRPLG